MSICPTMVLLLLINDKYFSKTSSVKIASRCYDSLSKNRKKKLCKTISNNQKTSYDINILTASLLVFIYIIIK